MIASDRKYAHSFMRIAAIAIFRARHARIPRQITALRWRALGARIDNDVILGNLAMTWPHQVSIGAESLIEDGVSFKFDGAFTTGPRIRIGKRAFVGRNTEFNINEGIDIGDDALIASGCRFVDHDHGRMRGVPMNRQPDQRNAICLGRDVWIGTNAVVLRGCRVGDGSIVGAGAVLTRDVPDYEIWGGVPARRIGIRDGR
jgi:acetyltransferase-like isoleucine patch superfamily enzyme